MNLVPKPLYLVKNITEGIEFNSEKLKKFNFFFFFWQSRYLVEGSHVPLFSFCKCLLSCRKRGCYRTFIVVRHVDHLMCFQQFWFHLCTLWIRAVQRNVLKPGPDRPVQPIGSSPGPLSGSVPANNRSDSKTGLKSENRSSLVVEPPIRKNRYRIEQPGPENLI